MVSSCIPSLCYISVTGMPLIGRVRFAIEANVIVPIAQIYVQLFDNPSRAREALSTGKGSVFGSSDKTMSRPRRLVGRRGKEGKKKS